MYSQEQRKLQSDFGTEKLADKLVNMIVKSTLEERDRAFLESERCFLSPWIRKGDQRFLSRERDRLSKSD